MKRHYKTKPQNITKLKSYLESKPKTKTNERGTRHSSGRGR